MQSNINSSLRPVNPDGTNIGTPSVVNIANGSLTSLGTTVTFDMTNYRMGYFVVTGTFSLTFTLEATFDGGGTWVAWPYHNVNLYTTIWQTSNAGSGTRGSEFWGAGSFQMRVRTSAYTSGTGTVTVYGCPQSTFPSLLNAMAYCQGYTARDAAASASNPVVIGVLGSRALPTGVAADGRNVEAFADRSGRLVVTGGDSVTRISTNTTTVVKNAPGKLQRLIINKTLTGTVTIYDNTSAAGTVIGTYAIGTTPMSLMFGCLMGTGITVVTSAADDITVTYSD